MRWVWVRYSRPGAHFNPAPHCPVIGAAFLQLVKACVSVTAVLSVTTLRPSPPVVNISFSLVF